MFLSWIGWIGAVLMALVCTFAFTKGDRIERIGATAFLIAWLITNLAGDAFGDEGQGNWFMLLIDLGLLATFASIVWKAPRAWPVWACAFQILIVASQILILCNLDTPIISYYRVVNMASFAILITLAVGTFFAWQEKVAVKATSKELGGYS